MKKNFFKRLAIALALTTAVTSINVPTAAKAAAAPAFKSGAASLTVGQSKNYGTKNSSAYSVKFVIGNSKIATRTFKQGVKTVKLTGVKEGKTTLRADFKNYKTKKVIAKRISVTVKAAPVTTAELSGVTQTASNAFTVKFTADASKLAAVENFTVVSSDSTSALSVKSVKMAPDGLSGVVTVYGNFVNGITYNVTCDKKVVPFIAEVGAVTRVVVNTTAVQQNVESDISFTLFDAAGIDVTPSISLNTYCSISIDGSYSTASLSKPDSAKIIMDSIGAKATVTITYNSLNTSAADIVGTGVITCVDPQATIGASTMFAQTSDINIASTCARFYLPGTATKTPTAYVEGSAQKAYFCALDANGEAISYDSYTVSSSNDNILSANEVVGKDSGRFLSFEVVGNGKGTATVNITATKNGKATPYIVSYVVKERQQATKMEVTVDKTTMSNADDSAYFSSIKVKLLDANNEEVEGTYSSKVVSNLTNEVNLKYDNGNILPGAAGGTQVFANGATKGGHVVEVTGSDKYNDNFTKRVAINVSELPKTITNVTYQIVLDNSVLDTNPQDADAANIATARLAAYTNNLFAGYVNGTKHSDLSANGFQVGSDTHDYDIVAATASAIAGTNNFKPGDALTKTNSKTAAEAATAYDTSRISFRSIDVTSGGAIDTLTDVAKTGNYTVKFEIQTKKGQDTNAKPSVKTNTFTIKNTTVLPTVKVMRTTTSDLNTPVTIISECLKTNVDMNNNVSLHESIKSFTDINGNPVTAANNKLIVKYATVEDVYGGNTWVFYVPINATFRAE